MGHLSSVGANLTGRRALPAIEPLQKRAARLKAEIDQAILTGQPTGSLRKAHADVLDELVRVIEAHEAAEVHRRKQVLVAREAEIEAARVAWLDELGEFARFLQIVDGPELDVSSQVSAAILDVQVAGEAVNAADGLLRDALSDRDNIIMRIGEQEADRQAAIATGPASSFDPVYVGRLGLIDINLGDLRGELVKAEAVVATTSSAASEARSALARAHAELDRVKVRERLAMLLAHLSRLGDAVGQCVDSLANEAAAADWRDVAEFLPQMVTHLVREQGILVGLVKMAQGLASAGTFPAWRGHPEFSGLSFIMKTSLRMEG